MEKENSDNGLEAKSSAILRKRFFKFFQKDGFNDFYL
jgi:hypothetical protein